MRFFAPPSDLAACFTSFYRVEVQLPEGASVSDYLQPEWANLRFFSRNPPRAHLVGGGELQGARFIATGPSSLPTHFSMRATRMWGIGLLPLGWARFVGVPACAHANTLVQGTENPVFAKFAPLGPILSRLGSTDEEQFDGAIAFFRQLAPRPPDHERIVAVHEAMVDPYLLQVAELAERAGMSIRTLERICARHFGFAPQLLMRRQRLMRSLAAFMLAETSKWSEVIDRHYHDQAHFVHEFHTFMTMSPSEYAALPHPILGAFMAERQRLWGSPVQTLDRPKEAH